VSWCVVGEGKGFSLVAALSRLARSRSGSASQSISPPVCRRCLSWGELGSVVSEFEVKFWFEGNLRRIGARFC
jgi:mevalonate pyrophosphate decarboxylase